MTDIYQRLRDRLDTMSTGYPATKNGSEIKLLQMLFSEQEAALFLDMTIDPETAGQAAARLGRDENALASGLESMARKGLLFRERGADGRPCYSAPPFIVGILEFQIKRMPEDPDLARAVAVFGFNGFIKSLTVPETPHQRTIPINQSLVSQWPIATYDDAVSILDQHQVIGVAPCMCRVLSHRLGVNKCGKPVETCMGFDSIAEFYIENGFARRISRDEAVSILKKSDEAGLVLQPMNAKDVGTICSCCGDCCAIMMSLKMHPAPAKHVKSHYYAEVEPDACIGCGDCLSRCAIDAIRMNDEDVAAVDLNRCLGCGLCVTTCPADAVSLKKKEAPLLYEPPADHRDLFRRMERDRGFSR